MLKSFMIMPETILRQLEMLEVDKAPGPDELHSSTEMEAACGIANFYRYFFGPSPRIGLFKRIEERGANAVHVHK